MNLIERLRDRYSKHSQELRDQAAEEIERLTAEVSELQKRQCPHGDTIEAHDGSWCLKCKRRIADTKAEIERLIDENSKLWAVYEAVMPLKVSGTHLYDCDIALGKAIAALQEVECE